MNSPDFGGSISSGAQWSQVGGGASQIGKTSVLYL